MDSRMNISFVLSLCCVFLSASLGAEVYNEHRPVCSPDGSRMVFMKQWLRTDGDWELYLVDMESQSQARLTAHPGWDGYPVWSPDGERIVFNRGDADGDNKQPWLMDMNSFETVPLGEYESWVSISDWPQAGKLLAFHDSGGQRDLVWLNEQGEMNGKLTDTRQFSEHDAHVSPDGKVVAYASETVGGGPTRLEIINLDSGDKSVLHESPGRIYGIDWSPDGQSIAFVDAPGGEEDDADIFLFHREDGRIERLTDNPAWDHMPEFCGDFHHLIFTSYRSGEERMYRMDPAPGPMLKIERAGQ
jgi:Tol biopolymer transport system component